MVKSRVPLSSCPVEDTPVITMPSSVAKAMQLSFGVEITGYLSSVRYEAGELSLKGIVFGDRERRFEDGSSIITSIVLDSQELQGFLVVRTLRSVYVVCDWAGDCAREHSKTRH